MTPTDIINYSTTNDTLRRTQASPTPLDVTDEELTDLWEGGGMFGDGISHEQHLRIAGVLHRRHGAAEAKERLLNGTRSACERYGCPESSMQL